MRPTTSFVTSILLITSILLTGGVITIGISLTDTLAFSDKILEHKQIQQQQQQHHQQQEQKDNDKNYQHLYKQYDFEKYLNYYYTYNTEYKENPDSNSDADISEENPFAEAANT